LYLSFVIQEYMILIDSRNLTLTSCVALGTQLSFLVLIF